MRLYGEEARRGYESQQEHKPWHSEHDGGYDYQQGWREGEREDRRERDRREERRHEEEAQERAEERRVHEARQIRDQECEQRQYDEQCDCQHEAER